MRLLTYLSRVQGIYYLIMGLWPILDLHSFMAFTGPKTDTWLVRTAGVLIADIALVLLIAQYTHHIHFHVAVMAMAATFGLGVIDVLNSITGRIPVIYLADAFIQWFFFTAWLIAVIKLKENVKHKHV